MTRRPRSFRWDPPESPPAHPYRDTLLVYGGFSVVIVIVAWASGGSVTHAVEIAVAFFVAASAWSSWRWRQRLARRAARSRDEEAGS